MKVPQGLVESLQTLRSDPCYRFGGSPSAFSERGNIRAPAESASYVVLHRGVWQCFLCDAVPSVDGSVAVTPRDSLHTRLYLAPLGLDVIAEAGRFRHAVLSLATNTLCLQFETGEADGVVLPLKARVCACARVCARACMHACVHTHACVCMCMLACAWVCMRACVKTCVYTCAKSHMPTL